MDSCGVYPASLSNQIECIHKEPVETMDSTDSLKKFVRLLESSSVSLVKLDSAGRPVAGGASGCLVDYKGKRYLLTVAHAMREGPPLSLSIRWDSDKRAVMTQQIGKCLSRAAIGTLQPGSTTIDDIQMTEIDFAYCRYPFNFIPEFQELDQSGSEKILQARPCAIYGEQQLASPDPQKSYGFAGHTRPCLEPHPEIEILSTRLQVCTGLTLVGKNGYFDIFQLPVKHPGHEFFEGCSGAPVIDVDGNLVGLIVKGNTDDSTISAVPINLCTQILDYELISDDTLANEPETSSKWFKSTEIDR